MENVTPVSAAYARNIPLAEPTESLRTRIPITATTASWATVQTIRTMLRAPLIISLFMNPESASPIDTPNVTRRPSAIHMKVFAM